MKTTTEQATQHETSRFKDLFSRIGNLILTSKGPKTEIDRFSIGDIMFDATDAEAFGFVSTNKDLSTVTPTQSRKERKVNTITSQQFDPSKVISDEEFTENFLTNVAHVKPDTEEWKKEYDEGLASIKKLPRIEPSPSNTDTAPKV